MGIVTVEKLENADKDADALEKFVEGGRTEIVKTRKNKQYPTLENAVYQVIETGGFEPFSTEAELLKSIPILTKKAAKALDTKKVWLWDGNQWHDTGSSEKDLANQFTILSGYTTSLKNHFTEDQFTSKIKREAYSDAGFEYLANSIKTKVQNGFYFYKSEFKENIISFSATVYSENPNVSMFVNIRDEKNTLISTIQQTAKIALENGMTVFFVENVDISAGHKIYFGLTSSAGGMDVYFHNFTVIESSKAAIAEHSKKEIGNDALNRFPYPALRDYKSTSKATVDYVTENNIEYMRVKPTGSGLCFVMFELTQDQYAASMNYFCDQIKITGNVAEAFFRIRQQTDSNNTNQAVSIYKDFSYIAAGDVFKLDATVNRVADTGVVRLSFSFNATAANSAAILIPTMRFIETHTCSNVADSIISVSSRISEEKTEVLKNAVNLDITAINSELQEMKSNPTSVVDAYIEKGYLTEKAGLLNDRLADYNYSSCWGSSSIQLMSPHLQTMFNSLAVPNHWNGGGSGEIAEHHAARMGAIPVLLTVPSGIIADVTTVETTFPSNRAKYFKATEGTVAGVEGTLSYSTDKFIFTRKNTGNTTVSTATQYTFSPLLNVKFVSGYVVLNVGKNSIDEGFEVDHIFDITVKMYNFIKPYFKRAIIINHYANTNYTTAQIDKISQLNEKLKNKFGDLYFDNRTYLTSQAFTDLGFTKTTEDEAAILAGKIPPTMTYDGVHMHSDVSQAFVENVVKPRVREYWF